MAASTGSEVNNNGAMQTHSLLSATQETRDSGSRTVHTCTVRQPAKNIRSQVITYHNTAGQLSLRFSALPLAPRCFLCVHIGGRAAQALSTQRELSALSALWRKHSTLCDVVIFIAQKISAGTGRQKQHTTLFNLKRSTEKQLTQRNATFNYFFYKQTKHCL